LIVNIFILKRKNKNINRTYTYFVRSEETP